MKTRLSPRAGILVVAVLMALTLLAGCRAFEPEAVIVNQAPETYIIGSPMEHGGGYYHFHVYWYGSDRDGKVEKFVWALTDTTLQDPDTVEDEEDENFNPALDASQLSIGHWTTKTDSIFDFTINQGVGTSYDMTLHMVAVDDYGDYDRTPARLHFFSNTLGNPTISFFRVSEGDTAEISVGVADTVGYNRPYQIFWKGSSPNVRGYDPVALAKIDTVYPYDDGLFGYKWRIDGELGGNCLDTLTDCWHPRLFNEAVGDSFSYFGDVTSLIFRNDGSGTSPFRELLPDGPVALQVNSIDVAGVEVADYLRKFTFLVNYDPITVILDNEQDWAHPEDDETYPYYIRLNDPNQIHYPFGSGDRVPDRSYVVFKALGKDHPNDVKRRTDYGMGFTGYVRGAIRNYTGGTYNFLTSASALDTFPQWGESADGWYADTLGFLVAPKSTMTINMQSVDEWGRRDGTPAQLSFDVGRPPCVQCIEVLPADQGSAFDETLACYDPDDGAPHPCFGDTKEYYAKSTAAVAQPGRTYLTRLNQIAFFAIDRTTKFATFVTDTTLMNRTHFLIKADVFGVDILYHGHDDSLEVYDAEGQERWRTMAWKTQIDYDCDPTNQIKDGGGADNLGVENWGVPAAGGLEIDDQGLWKKKVSVYVPSDLLTGGLSYYRGQIYFTHFWDGMSPPDLTDPRIDELVDITKRQFGLARVRGIMLDRTQCNTAPLRPGYYHTFKGLRPPTATPPLGKTWRSCDLTGVESSIPLPQMAMPSNDDEPVENFFRITVQTNNGEDIVCTGNGF